MKHYIQAIVGCGDNPLPCADDSCSAPPPDCYTFNMEQGWRKIASPGRPYSPLASGALVNGNGILYYIEDLGSVFQYSTEEDHWTKIGEDISRRSCILNTRCVTSLVNDGLFAQFTCSFPHFTNIIYRFDLDAKAWTELPQNIHDTHVGSLCLTIELEDKRPGVMLVGGHTLNQTSFLTIEHNTVEILDLVGGVWTDMEMFDEGWIHGKFGLFGSYQYGFLYLDDKPSIIGSFNGTMVNVKEQFDIAQNSWTMEVFDIEDAYSVDNAINVPTTIFPLCSY